MLTAESISKIQSICKISPGYRQSLDLAYLVSTTNQIKLFKDLNSKQGENAHILCCQYLLYDFIPANQYVFRYGDPGTKFFILLSGAVSIQIPINDSGQISFTEVMTFTSGSSFGELALETLKPRSASAFCKSDSHFLILLKKDYSALIQRLVTEKKNEMVNFLQCLPPFQRLNKLSISKLTYNIREINIRKGQYLFYEGDSAKEIFIIREGECKLCKNILKPGSSSCIRKIQYTRIHTAKRIGNGSLIGEDDVFNKSPHSYSCVCSSDNALVYAIPSNDFFIRITAEQPLKYLKKLSKEKKRFFEEWTANRKTLDKVFVRNEEKVKPKKKSTKIGLIKFNNIEKLNKAVTERKKLLSRNSPAVSQNSGQSLWGQLIIGESHPGHKKTMSTGNLIIKELRDIKTACMKRPLVPNSSMSTYRSVLRRKSNSGLEEV